MRDFVGTVAEAGCKVFIVHARNAWLKGLSPKENRQVPPLRYGVRAQLKQDFPHLTIAINGGFTDDASVQAQLQQVDGVMVGREVYHNPWWLSRWDEVFYGDAPQTLTREAVEATGGGIHGPRGRTAWHALVRHCTPHAGLAPRPARRTALAASLEQPTP